MKKNKNEKSKKMVCCTMKKPAETHKISSKEKKHTKKKSNKKSRDAVTLTSEIFRDATFLKKVHEIVTGYDLDTVNQVLSASIQAHANAIRSSVEEIYGVENKKITFFLDRVCADLPISQKSYTTFFDGFCGLIKTMIVESMSGLDPAAAMMKLMPRYSMVDEESSVLEKVVDELSDVKEFASHYSVPCVTTGQTSNTKKTEDSEPVEDHDSSDENFVAKGSFGLVFQIEPEEDEDYACYNLSALLNLRIRIIGSTSLINTKRVWEIFLENHKASISEFVVHNMGYDQVPMHAMVVNRFISDEDIIANFIARMISLDQDDPIPTRQTIASEKLNEVISLVKAYIQGHSDQVLSTIYEYIQKYGTMTPVIDGRPQFSARAMKGINTINQTMYDLTTFRHILSEALTDNGTNTDDSWLNSHLAYVLAGMSCLDDTVFKDTPPFSLGDKESIFGIFIATCKESLLYYVVDNLSYKLTKMREDTIRRFVLNNGSIQDFINDYYQTYLVRTPDVVADRITDVIRIVIVYIMSNSIRVSQAVDEYLGSHEENKPARTIHMTADDRHLSDILASDSQVSARFGDIYEKLENKNQFWKVYLDKYDVSEYIIQNMNITSESMICAIKNFTRNVTDVNRLNDIIVSADSTTTDPNETVERIVKYAKLFIFLYFKNATDLMGSLLPDTDGDTSNNTEPEDGGEEEPAVGASLLDMVFSRVYLTNTASDSVDERLNRVKRLIQINWNDIVKAFLIGYPDYRDVFELFAGNDGLSPIDFASDTNPGVHFTEVYQFMKAYDKLCWHTSSWINNLQHEDNEMNL